MTGNGFFLVGWLVWLKTADILGGITHKHG